MRAGRKDAEEAEVAIESALESMENLLEDALLRAERAEAKVQDLERRLASMVLEEMRRAKEAL